MNYRKQSSTSYPFFFFMTSTTDHVTGGTSANPSVSICKSGESSFSPASGSVTEVGSGWYYWAGNATDRNTLGEISLIITGSNVDPIPAKMVVVPWDPFDANLSLQALPAAAAGALGGLPTVDASNGVKLSVGTGTGQVVLTSGQVRADQVTGSVGSISGATFPANFGTLAIDSDGLVSADVQKIAGSAASVNATVDANVVSVNGTTFVGDSVPANVIAGGISAASFSANSIDSTAFAQNAADKVWASTDARALKVDNLDAAVSTRSTFAGGAVASVTDPVQIDLTQAVPTSNTAQTVGDALNAARAQGFGKWVLDGTSLTLYAANGTTVVRTFTLDSATTPTRRS